MIDKECSSEIREMHNIEIEQVGGGIVPIAVAGAVAMTYMTVRFIDGIFQGSHAR